MKAKIFVLQFLFFGIYGIGVARQSDSSFLSIQIASSREMAENNPISLYYSDMFLDFKYKVPAFDIDHLSFPSGIAYKNISFRYKEAPYSFLVSTDDTLIMEYLADRIALKSISNHPFVRVSEEITRATGPLSEPQRLAVSYGNLDFYMKLIDARYNRRLKILDSLKVPLSLTENQQRVFLSEIRGWHFFDKLRPFYPGSSLHPDSVPTAYLKEVEKIKEYLNGKEIDRTLSINRLLAFNYFKFFLCSRSSFNSLDDALQIIERNFDPFWQDVVAFYHIKETYFKLRMPEKKAIQYYRESLASSLHLAYLDNEEAKYIDLLNDSIGSARFATSIGEKKSLRDIIKRYPGKALYIDFWASWCIPCIGEMPASAKLSKGLADKDVLFLYISIDKSKDAWMKQAEKLNILGDNSLIISDESDPLIKRLNVKTIPRYVIVDKYGQIVEQEAFRPSDIRVKKKLVELADVKFAQ